MAHWLKTLDIAFVRKEVTRLAKQLHDMETAA